MDPYQVLGIPPNATEDQIKTAYRKLVKEYHPDRNKSATAAVIIQRINEAYEVLTDPERNQRHQHETYKPDQRTEQQRAYEEGKAAFLKKKREQAKQDLEAKLRRDQKQFKVTRMAAFPLLIVGLLFVTDQLLPPVHFSETSERGWQKVSGGSRRHPGGKRHNYMRTAHFKRLEVPNRVLLDYDFYIKPGMLNIDASPLLEIPKTIVVETKGNVFKFEALGTPYSALIPFHYLLAITSCLTIWRRQFSYGNLMVAFIPIVLFFLLVYMWLI